MIFVIQVNSAPYQNQSAYTALQFCRAVLQQQHQIKRVFFYHDGIYNAFASAEAATGQYDIITGWTRLATVHQIDLLVCISAARLRGLTPSNDADSTLLADGFRIGGLGEMAEAMIEADRVLTFQ